MINQMLVIKGICIINKNKIKKILFFIFFNLKIIKF
jgi:hypothetical protein